MAAPPKIGGIFSPTQVSDMARAYERAVHLAGEEGGCFATMPVPLLRHRLASFIVSETRKGPIATERLVRAALDGARSMAPDAPITLTLAR